MRSGKEKNRNENEIIEDRNAVKNSENRSESETVRDEEVNKGIRELEMTLERMEMSETREEMLERGSKISGVGEKLNFSGNLTFLIAEIVHKILPKKENGFLRREYFSRRLSLGDEVAHPMATATQARRDNLIKLEACINAKKLLEELQDSSR